VTLEFTLKTEVARPEVRRMETQDKMVKPGIGEEKGAGKLQSLERLEQVMTVMGSPAPTIDGGSSSTADTGKPPESAPRAQEAPGTREEP